MAAAVILLSLFVALALFPSGGAGPRVSHEAAHHGSVIQVRTQFSTTSNPTDPLLPDRSVTVQVLNASGSGELATKTAVALKKAGFVISSVNDAPSVISPGDPSDIFYGSTGLTAARTLAAVLNGLVSYIPDSSLVDNNVSLWIANAQLTVKT